MKHVLYILIFASSLFVMAQEPYAIKYNKSNGLPSNAIFNVLQDSKGFMWFASNAGLTRYDGFEYKTYTSPAQTSTPGSSIVEDRYGRIWYENFDGYIYYIENDSLHALKQNKPIQYLPITLTQKHVFVFQKNGVDVYDLKTLKIIVTRSLSINNIEFTTCNKKNFYYIDKDILYRIDENLVITRTDFLKKEKTEIKQLYYNDQKIYVISKYNTSKLMYVFNESLMPLYNIPIKEPEFIQGISFTDSLIWIHTPQGTHSYLDTKQENTFHRVFFKDKNMSCVKKDRQHNYWFSTINQGIFMAPNLNTIVYIQPNILPNKIVAIKDGYLIGTKQGELSIHDSLLNFKYALNKQTDNSEIYYMFYDSVSNDLFYSSKGFTYLPNLNYTNRKNYQPAIKEIVKINENYYAIAASGFCGLAKFNSPTKQVSLWDKTYTDHQMPEVSYISSLVGSVRGKAAVYNKEKNTIYFATNVGLYKCTPNATEEIKIKNESFYASKLIFHNGIIYSLSTKGDLYKIKNEKDFEIINNNTNLTNFDVKLIKQYGKTMVIITNNFAYLLNLDNQQLTQIEVNINAYEINDVLLSNSSLFFLTNSGIVKTAITTSSTKTNDATLELTDFSANGKLLSCAKKNELAYNQNDIAIRFSILDFGNSRTNNVSYKVNEGEWKLVANETRLIEFAALKPGKYIIQFKINETIAASTIQFTIDAPFWQTIWFMFVCFVILLAFGYGYYQWQLNKLRIKNKLLEDKNSLLQEKIELEHNLNKSVLKSIKAQMNPHFFYNALNTIQAYIFTNDKTKANSYLAKFSKLTRVILEQSEKETISLGDEIESLTLYLELEKMRFTEEFEYTIEQKIMAHKEGIEFPPMLIQPYVENAIKHGLLHKESDRKLIILFEEIKNNLVITIDDNGIGRKRSEELNKIKNDKYQSFSTQANEKRLEILNRTNDKIAVKIIDKHDTNGQSLGTKVILTIPII